MSSDIPCVQHSEVKLDGEFVALGAHCDTLRCHGEFIQLVSLIGTSATMKSFRAWLASKTSSVRLKHGNNELKPSLDGYTFHSESVAPGWVHLIGVSRTPGVVIGGSHGHWKEFLIGPNVTTPMLDDWVDYVSGRVKESNRCRELWGFGEPCYLVKMDGVDSFVDYIVSSALKEGVITI